MKEFAKISVIFVLLMVAIMLLGVNPSPVVMIISKVAAGFIGYAIVKLLVVWNMIDLNERA